MSDSRQVTINFISSMAQKIFSRAIHGQCAYENDMRQLQNYIKQARSLQDNPLELQLLNTVAVVTSVSGYLAESCTLFRELYERYAMLNDIDGMVTSLNNQALCFDFLGKQAEALQVYDEGMALIANASTPPYKIRSYGLLMTGRMGILSIFNRFEEIEESFDAIQQTANEFLEYNREEYVRTMMYAYHNMAEVMLQRGDVNEALVNYNLSIDLAKGGNLMLEIGAIHFTRAHIETARQDPLEADAYWQAGEAAVAALELPIMAGVQFTREARYLRRKNMLDKSEYFARRALGVFEQHNIMEGRQVILQDLHI